METTTTRLRPSLPLVVVDEQPAKATGEKGSMARNLHDAGIFACACKKISKQ